MKQLLLFLFFVAASTASPAVGLSVAEEDLVQLVKQKNGLVEAGEKEIASLEAKTGHLTRSFIPTASLVAGQESFRYVINRFQSQPYYTITTEFNIYNGGRDQIKGQIENVNLAEGLSRQKINFFGQLEEARKTFWRAVYLKKLILQYDKALKLVRKNKQEARRRIRSGVATQSDQYEFDIKEVELNQDQKRAQLKLEKEKSHLKVLIGVRQSDTLNLSQELAHDHKWRRLIEHSEEDHNYLVKPSQLEVKKMNLKSGLAGRAWLPRIDAYAFWLQNNQRMDFERIEESERQQTAFGIRATWSFSDWITGNVEKKSATALAMAHGLKLGFQKRELESELHMEIRELELLDSMVHDASENIERSRKFFGLVAAEYKRGVKSSGDMLKATEKLVFSEVRMMEIIRDFQLAKAHIMTKMGQ